MRLLEIGMGCSMHEGVNGLNTLAVCQMSFRFWQVSVAATSPDQRVTTGCLQLWRRYLTNTKISFVENDAKCVQKHKTEIEKVAQGKVYVGECQ